MPARLENVGDGRFRQNFAVGLTLRHELPHSKDEPSMLVDAGSGGKERDQRLHQVPLSQLMRPALFTRLPLIV